MTQMLTLRPDTCPPLSVEVEVIDSGDKVQLTSRPKQTLAVFSHSKMTTDELGVGRRWIN